MSFITRYVYTFEDFFFHDRSSTVQKNDWQDKTTDNNKPDKTQMIK